MVSRANAHTSSATPPAVRDDVDEPPHERADEIGRQRVQRRLAAAYGHVGQQGEPQRMTMGDLDQAVLDRLVDPARSLVAAAVLRTEVAQRHDPQELAPRGRRAMPCLATGGPPRP